MRKISSALLFIIIINSGFSQTYKEQLKAVNDYLKTFDNGYYGYLEIKDGFLYDRFPSGKYSKSEIKYLGNAVALDNEYKISIECTDSKDCVFSTYTDSYHKNISFSQSEYFDKEVLVGLLNNLLTAYKKNTGNYKNDVALIENKTSTSSNSNYQTALKKLNDYLKTFDNGYYGYLEIKDGYLYDRFKDGNNYCKAKISDIGKAYEKEPKRKVELYCKGTDNCLFSTFTNQNYNSFSFSQSTDFNTTELISLLDNLVAACKETNTKNKDEENNIDYAAEKRRQESLKSNTDNNGNNTTSTKNNSTGNYQSALKKLNDYLAKFDNGYYGYFEVKDGYIYDRFKAGKYNKFKMEDIEGAVIQEQYSRVIFKCKGENKCISTDWKVNGTEDYTQFTQSGSYNYQELADLLNNFRDAYLGKKQTSTNNSTVSANKSREEKAKERQQPTSKTNDDDLDEDWDALEKAAAPLGQVLKESNKNTSSNYQPALKNLNEYLKTYNAETYKDVVVKDGKVYFGFFVYGANYKSSIDINELKNNTIITIGKSVGSSVVDEVKISCKGSSKCFYSTYSNENADHFRFFSHTIKDFTKMEQLLKDFIKALN